MGTVVIKGVEFSKAKLATMNEESFCKMIKQHGVNDTAAAWLLAKDHCKKEAKPFVK